MPSKSIKKSLSKSIKKSLKYSRKKCPFGSISRIGYTYKKKSLNNKLVWCGGEYNKKGLD